MHHRLALLAFAASIAAAAPASRPFGEAGTTAEAVQVAPDAALFFTSGWGSHAKPPLGDTRTQTRDALAYLESLAKAAGLSLNDAVFGRTYLAPEAGGRYDFAGWGEAWDAVFSRPGLHAHPARTVIGVPTVGGHGYLVEIELLFATGKPAAMLKNSAALGLPVKNPRLAPYGTRDFRIYEAMGVRPGTALYFTPGTGMLEDYPNPNHEPATYIRAIHHLKAVEENLASVGLGWGDVIALKAWLGPDPALGGKFDADSWNRAYGEVFNNPSNPHKPVRVTMAAPVFRGNHPGAVEIEVIAAFPGDNPALAKTDPGNAHLHTYMSPAPPWADGVAVKPHTALYFSSAIAPESGDTVETQALSVLAALQKRLASAGMGMKDVVFLRAYVVPKADGSSIDWDGWTAAYQKYFNNSGQRHKPARTTLAVDALPNPGEKIAIDVIAAAP